MESYILNVTKPTTIKLIALNNGAIRFLKVFDSINELEYIRDFEIAVKKCSFNLPKSGRYKILLSCKVSVEYLDLEKNKLPILPPFDRYPKDIKLSFVRTPKIGSPASINVNTQKIYLHANFFKFPLYIKRFIVAHEIGHLFYNSEQNADLWATHHLLGKGYNYTQSVNALINSLKGAQRANRIEHNLKQVTIK